MLTALGPLAAARSVASVVEANAEAAERAGILPAETVAALTSAGLFGLMVPRVLGGGEVDLPTVIDALAEVARQDASTGWSLMANVTGSAFAAAYMGDEAVAIMFGDPARPGIHAGQLSPRGQAVAEPGGYRVTGSYSFGSGSGYATWITAGTFPLRDGNVPMPSNGFPEIRAVAVPRAAVELRGNWDVLGLRGTGSYDYTIDDVFVPEAFTFDLLGAVPMRGGPVYTLGVGRRAVDEITALAQSKHRLGDSRMAEKPTFQLALARMEAKIRSARLFVIDTFGAAERTAQAGSALDARQQQMTRIAATYATELATEVTDFAYRMGGSEALRQPSVLGRCFRDIHAATQHIFVDDRTYVDGGAALLGLAPSY